MPYIKQELRPQFNNAIQRAMDGDYLGAELAIMDAIRKYDVLTDYLTLDGCLNYVFTQLLRKVSDLYVAKIAILDVIIVVTDKPRYGLLERILGMLFSMIREFKRRGWREEAIPAIEEIINHFGKLHYDPYEDNAMKNNGDLE